MPISRGTGSSCARSAAYDLPNALRLTIGSEEANRKVVATLEKFLRGAAPARG